MFKMLFKQLSQRPDSHVVTLNLFQLLFNELSSVNFEFNFLLLEVKKLKYYQDKIVYVRQIIEHQYHEVGEPFAKGVATDQ